MLTNARRREILNNVRSSGYPGSISEVFQAAAGGRDLVQEFQMQQQQQQQMQVANTQEEQATGLRDQHAQGNTQASMAFPDVQSNQSFNTVGMKAPIDIQKIDNQGHLVESYKNVPPGIQDLPTGPAEGTIIESPAAYKTGGYRKKYETGGDKEDYNLPPRKMPPWATPYFTTDQDFYTASTSEQRDAWRKTVESVGNQRKKENPVTTEYPNYYDSLTEEDNKDYKNITRLYKEASEKVRGKQSKATKENALDYGIGTVHGALGFWTRYKEGMGQNEKYTDENINSKIRFVDKVANLSDDDQQNLANIGANIGSQFVGVDGYMGALTALKNVDLSELKQYREKMGYTKDGLLKEVFNMGGDDLAPYNNKVIRGLIRMKDFKTGGYKQNDMKKQGGLRRYKQGGKRKRGYVQKYQTAGFDMSGFNMENTTSVQDNVLTPQVLQIQNEGENFIEKAALLAKNAKDKKIADNQIAMNKSKGTLVNTTKKNAANILSNSMLTNQLAGGYGGSNMRKTIEDNPDKIDEIYKNTMRSAGQNTMKWNALGVLTAGGGAVASPGFGGATNYLNHMGRGVDLMSKANRIRPFVKGAFQTGYNATKLAALPAFYNQTGNFGVDLATGNYDNLQKRVMDFGRGVVSNHPGLRKVKDYYKMAQDAYEGQYASVANRMLGLGVKSPGIGKGLEYYTSKVGGKFIPKSWQNLGGLPSIKNLVNKYTNPKATTSDAVPLIKAG